MDFDQGGNNCGITVVDITALHNLKYCFVMYQQDHIYWEDFQVMAPLRASNYLWPYRHIEMNQNTFQAKFQKLVQQFDGRDIVEVGALNGTWPRKEWQEKSSVKQPPSDGKINPILPRLAIN
jgi:hypothetical protein